MSMKTNLRASAALGMLLASPAFAAAVATPDASALRNNDDIVVTATKINAETPITASVHTFEPQAIVSRSIIENSVPPTADFSDVILLTPGASGTSNGNGPGLSESKTVLRGFQDGFYNITYDGIPFGDSNNPTHHSTAYFPTGTYERIIVDRGPGGATDLGQASFGGNVHLVSRELTERASFDAQAVYGSYKTYLGRLTAQSGAISALGDLKVIAVAEYKDTKGALTASPAWFVNGFLKLEKPLGDRAKISFLSSYNQNFYDQSDNNGISCTGTLVANGVSNGVGTSGNNCLATSQVGLYGKSFGLVDVNDSRFAGTPFTGARHDFNWTNKTTDFEIARFQLQFNDSISLDLKAYTNFYKNFTVSTQSSTAPCANTPTASACRSTLSVGGILSVRNGDTPGYTKLNQYRNYGLIPQIDFKTPFGVGKVGAWYESSSSHRYRYSYDLTAAANAGVFKYRQFDFAGMAAFYDYNRNTNNATNIQLSGAPVPTYIAYDEYTSWEQIQGFGEFAFKLFDDRLTLTPGVKVQSFTRAIVTPIASQSARVGIVAKDSYKPTLPYATANFLAKSNWSFYFQFAKGFLIPQLSDSLEAIIPNGAGAVKCSTASTTNGNCNLQPTRTTNYQFGTVYAGERLNIDADVYYIKATNSTSVDPSTGLTSTSGIPALYKGVEAQVSYLLLPHFTGIVNGSVNTAKNDNAAKLWLTQAPDFTALAGLVYNSGRLKLSYLHKFTGRQFADAGNAVRIAPYSTGIAAGTVYFGPVGVGVTVYNVFGDRSTTKIGSSTGPTPLYFYQPGRSFEAQARLRF
jgi:iron complex outermembrane receptor protein